MNTYISTCHVQLMAIAVHLPASPRHPPSKAAEIRASTAHVTSSLVSEVLAVIVKPSFLCLVVAGGINMGLYGMWFVVDIAHTTVNIFIYIFICIYIYAHVHIDM